jgi:hypothetical protein
MRDVKSISPFSPQTRFNPNPTPASNQYGSGRKRLRPAYVLTPNRREYVPANHLNMNNGQILRSNTCARCRIDPIGSARAPLFYRERQPAQVEVHHQPGLPARELQNGTLLVGEHDRADTADDRKPRAGGTIHAFNV